MPGPKARTFNYRAGDVGYVPVGGFHYVQNTGKEKLIYLEVFNSNHYSDISLAQWMVNTPREVVKSVLNLSDGFLDKLQQRSNPVVKYAGFEFPPAKGTPQNVRYYRGFDYEKKPVDVGSGNVMNAEKRPEKEYAFARQ